MVHIVNPSILEAEESESLWVQTQPGLQSDQVRICLKKKRRRRKKKKEGRKKGRKEGRRKEGKKEKKKRVLLTLLFYIYIYQ